MLTYHFPLTISFQFPSHIVDFAIVFPFVILPSLLPSIHPTSVLWMEVEPHNPAARPSAVPLCRCRVLYIGSAVPTITKDGLQGVQQPLRERYPVEDTPETRGIDSWLSVWSDGVLLEYIEGDRKQETAFFEIDTMHYCGAVRYVNVTGFNIEGGGERFIPLDSPFANIPNSPHPPIFAAIFRRTTGVKVLECHGFICANENAAQALVRCTFFAYFEKRYLETKGYPPKAIKDADERQKEISMVGEGSPVSDRREDGGRDGFREEARRNHWEWRQQTGECETASISSSTEEKKGVVRRAASENGRQVGRSLVPVYNDRRSRRFGSEADLPMSDEEEERVRGRTLLPDSPFMHHRMPPPFFMPPPPHLLPPGMQNPMMMFHPPPPHLLPPHLRGPMPPAYPHPAAFFGRFPPPPPGAMFPPPPFPPPPGMFPGGAPPFRPPSGDGPIITGPESVYGTMARGRTYEDRPSMGTHDSSRMSYVGGTMGRGEPRPDYEETTPRMRRANGGANEETDSPWDRYEDGIYRKPHLNEKAFSNTLKREANDGYDTLRSKGNTGSRTMETEVQMTRPETPPVDYEAIDGMMRDGMQIRKRIGNGNSRQEASAC
ncbi:hypothetical protein PMAYCL1PPCAC_12981 [Pristionchus mayeri]|uniref:PID domain-containing protein n=1 Tax=Pristionchus mayeri TaxID=1317129 RepID=A0AAN5CH66_9BILA|nr:hypothetical protein PMAYCL1PPCAC_12981 [Pristionchus mayeri]